MVVNGLFVSVIPHTAKMNSFEAAFHYLIIFLTRTRIPWKKEVKTGETNFKLIELIYLFGLESIHSKNC